ncbi:MAG: peptide ABC transporter substrate-binding protein [Acidobacteriia bacterium]|nr:peptide ABC transporter substrate-binding protein [Terriglobia bacterium]
MQPKKKLRLASLLSILCALSLFIAACGGASTPSTQKNPAAAPADKQILHIPLEGGDFDSLDPALTSGGLGDPYNIIFNGLVTTQDDGSIIDQLAASHSVSSDGLTYTFTLRPNLKFSDGTPLTASDVAYSINRTLLPATQSDVRVYLSLLKDFDKVTSGTIPTLIGDSLIVKDDKTISIVLSKPAAYFLGALSYSTSFVVEKKLIDKYGNTWTDHLEEGGGCGPFKVKSYSHTTGLVLVPNPYYFGFQPKLTEIQYIIAADRDSNYKAFQVGQFDLAPVPPSQDEVAATKPGYQVVPALASRFIGLNYLSKPLDNIKIRQAFALAINKDLIINHIIGKFVTPSNHIVPKGIPGYNPNLTGPAGVRGTTGDQAKAKQLLQQGLQEAGYSSLSQLPSISITYSIDYKAGADTISAIANEWKQVLGISVKLIGVHGTDLIKQEADTVGHSGPLQMWYGNWGADYPDPQDWLTLFFGKGTDHNTFNYGQNNSSDAAQQQAVQAEMAQADGESDNATRIKLYNDAEQKIVNDVGWITTYQSSYVYSVNPKLQNWRINSLGALATEDWANIYLAQ